MANPQQQDWFAQNAPTQSQSLTQAQAPAQGGQDWFAQNSPVQPAPKQESTGFMSGVGDELSGIWESLKKAPELLKPPDPNDQHEIAIAKGLAFGNKDDLSARPALAAYRIGKAFLTQLAAGKTARDQAKAQGEGIAGQTLATLEQYPLIGDIVKRDEKGDVSGASGQAITRALTFGVGGGELSDAVGLGKAGEVANAAIKSGAGAVADATGVSKIADAAGRVAQKFNDAVEQAQNTRKQAEQYGVPVGPLATKGKQEAALAKVKTGLEDTRDTENAAIDKQQTSRLADIETVRKNAQGQIANAKAANSADLVKAGESIADEINAQAMSPAEASRFTADALSKAREAASDRYNSALSDISNAGARDVPVNLGNIQPTAKALVDELELPDNFSSGLKDVQGRDSAISFLKQFANPKGEATKVLDARGNAITKPATLSWENARRLKSQLNAWSNSGEITVGKGALQQMTGALDNAMTDALNSAGRSELAQQFKAASKGYGETMSAFEEGAIGKLAERNPDAVASALLNKSSVFNVNTLRKTIGAKNMPIVERSLWENIFQKAVDADGNLNGKLLQRTVRGLGPDVQQAIWGDRAAKINKFVSEAAKYQDTFKQMSEAADEAHDAAATDAKSQFGNLRNQVADNFKVQSRQLADFGSTAKNAPIFANGGKLAALGAAEPLIHFLPSGIGLQFAPYVGGAVLGYKLLKNPVVLDNLSTIMRNSMDYARAGGNATGKAAKLAAQNQQAIGKIMMVLNSTHASESMKQN